MRPESEVREIVRSMEEERDSLLSTEIRPDDPDAENKLGKIGDQLQMLNAGLAVAHATLGTKDLGAEKFGLDRFRGGLPESVQKLIED